MTIDATLPAVEPGLLVSESPTPSRTLLVAFAGIRGRLGGVPGFEFSNLTSDLAAHRVFVRDPRGLFFLRGVPGCGDSPHEVADAIRAHRDRLGATRVVVIGNSSGGYAAILFGALLDADVVHAIAAKSSVRSVHDFRDATVFERMERAGCADTEFGDLRATLLARPGRRGEIHLHYPSGEPVDVKQARRLADVPRVHLHAYPWDDHHVVRPMRDTGVLGTLVRDAVEGHPERHARTARWGAWKVRWARWRRPGKR